MSKRIEEPLPEAALMAIRQVCARTSSRAHAHLPTRQSREVPGADQDRPGISLAHRRCRAVDREIGFLGS